MDTEKIMNAITQEILAALQAMEKVKTPEEKLMHSKTIKNLSESLGVFFDLIEGLVPFDDDDDDDSIPF